MSLSPQLGHLFAIKANKHTSIKETTRNNKKESHVVTTSNKKIRNTQKMVTKSLIKELEIYLL